MPNTSEIHNFSSDVNTMTTHTMPPSLRGTDYQRIWNGVLGASLIFVNAVTFAFVVKTRALKLKAKLLVGCLAGTDFLFGIMALFPRLLPQQPNSRDLLCFIRFGGLFLSMYGATFTVTLIALDRAVAVSRPHFYRIKVTVEVMVLLVVAVWVLSVLMVIATLLDAFPPDRPCGHPFFVLSRRGLRTLCVVLLMCSSVLFVLYAFIGWQMKKRWNQIGTMLSYSGLSRRSERRTSLTGMLLAVSFLCGYIPVCLYTLWVTESGIDVMKEGASPRLYILVVFPILNCVLDPVIYFWRIKEWHSAICGKCRRRSNDGVVIVSDISGSSRTRGTEAREGT